MLLQPRHLEVRVDFAVGLDQSGSLSFAEYRALMDNPSTTDDPNDFVTLRTPGNDGVNIVYVTAISTDSDGDPSQNSAALNIQVRDDGLPQQRRGRVVVDVSAALRLRDDPVDHA